MQIVVNSNSTTSDSFSLSKNLEEIYNSKSLRFYIRSRLYAMRMNNVITEDDVLNYVLVELFKAKNSGKVIDSPLAWAKVVSERYIIHQKKKYQSTESLDENSFLLDRIQSSYEENLITSEEREELKQKIKLLKLESQIILDWRYFENLSWQEIAVLLSKKEGQEINPATARKRGERALHELRNLYMHSVTNQLEKKEISVPLTAQNHQENTEESNLVKEIRKKIHQLNPAEQKLVTLRFIDNLNWNKVAELLSKEEGNTISTAAVRKRGERAMRKLKEIHVEET